MSPLPQLHFSAVILDVDGTMVDNHPFHEEAWIRYGRDSLGIDITPEYYLAHINARSNTEILKTLLGPNISEREIRAHEAEKEALYRELCESKLVARAGLLAFMDRLRAERIPLAAASNAPRLNVDFVLNRLGIDDAFGAVVALEDVEHGKPDPALFLLAASRIGVPARECLVVEDSPSGMKAARAAGMSYVVIDNAGARCAPDLVTSSLAVVRDFEDALLVSEIHFAARS